MIPKEGDAVFVVCGIEASLVKEESWIEDIRPYVEFKESPMEFLADVLIEKGLEKKRVGIELDYLMAHYYKELVELLPNTEFVLCTKVFDKVRMIKEKREIELLGYAGSATRKAFEAAVLATKPGDTEKDLSKRAIKNIIDLGCDETSFMALASGNRSMLVHALPEEIPLVRGEIVRIDFGGLFNNYNSDVARTAMIGGMTTKHVGGYRYHVEDLIQITSLGPKVLTEKSLSPRLSQVAPKWRLLPQQIQRQLTQKQRQ